MRVTILVALGALSVTAVIAAVVLSGSERHDPFADAKEAVSSILIDPYSAQFRDLYRSKDDDGVCGEVNAKNRMGAYTGYTAFFHDETTGAVLLEQEVQEPRSWWTSEDHRRNLDVLTANLRIDLSCNRIWF